MIYIVAYVIYCWPMQMDYIHPPSTCHSCFVTNLLSFPSRNAMLPAISSGLACRLMIEGKLSSSVMVHGSEDSLLTGLSRKGRGLQRGNKLYPAPKIYILPSN